MGRVRQKQPEVESEHGSRLANPTSNIEQLNRRVSLDIATIPRDYNSLQNMDRSSKIADYEQLRYPASFDRVVNEKKDFNNESIVPSSYSEAPPEETVYERLTKYLSRYSPQYTDSPTSRKG
jgi:hypothetical protein